MEVFICGVLVWPILYDMLATGLELTGQLMSGRKLSLGSWFNLACVLPGDTRERGS